MSFKTRVIETLRSVFFAHPSTKIPHGMMNASDTIYRKTAPGFAFLSSFLSSMRRNIASHDFCRSQPEASIPNHTVPETAISYYKRTLDIAADLLYVLFCSTDFQVIYGRE
jgi:hypothetical protein